MARFKTFVNGGNVLPSDLDAMEDDYECAFGTYKVIASAGVTLVAAGGTNAYGNFAGTEIAAHLNPARFWSAASTSGVNPRSVFYNLSVAAYTGSTPIGTVTFTSGLYAVAGVSGGTPTPTLNASPVTGSTVSMANPGASALIPVVYSGDFAAPTSGLYAVAVVCSAAMAASSQIALVATLSVRQV